MTAISPNGPVQLKRELGLFSAVSFIISITIGSGIFVTPSSVFQYSKSVGMCIVVWCLSGVISLLGALTYAELSTLVPRSGSDYVYYMKAFDQFHRFWAKLPSFLYSFAMIWIIRPAAIAIVLMSCSEYFCKPISDAICIKDSEDADRIKLVVAVLALGIITSINTFSVKFYVIIQNIFVAFKVIACLIVVAGGIYETAIGNVKNLQKGFEGTTSSPKDIVLAFYSGLWAFDGWSMVTLITEDIRKPEVNILRSILISIPIVTILYVFMNASYMTTLTMDEMASSSAVAVTFGQSVLGKFAVVIPISVALSTFSSGLSLQFGITRVCYASAQDGLMLKSLSYVHHRKLTPIPAVVLQGIISLIFILMRDITKLIQFLSILKLMFVSLSMISLMILKRKLKHVHRAFEVPFLLPVFMFLVFVLLILTPIIMAPDVKYLDILCVLLVGTFFYYLFIYKNMQPIKLIGCINIFTQRLFEVVPSKSSDERDVENITKNT